MKKNLIIHVYQVNTNGTSGKTIGTALLRGDEPLLGPLACYLRPLASVDDISTFVKRAIKLEEDYGQSEQPQEGTPDSAQVDCGDGDRR